MLLEVWATDPVFEGGKGIQGKKGVHGDHIMQSIRGVLERAIEAWMKTKMESRYIGIRVYGASVWYGPTSARVWVKWFLRGGDPN